MLYVSHRINTISELININNCYGIEVDLRDDKNGNLFLSHDPFHDGELFSEFLKYYNHAFIICNIKSEGIEFKVIQELDKYKINKYFLLDSSIPMIYKLIKIGIKNIAVRFSEIESIETVLKFKNKVEWVWVDCFTSCPLNNSNFKILKDNNFKLCFVSPELQNQPEKIQEYKEYFFNNDISIERKFNFFSRMLQLSDYKPF